MSDNAGHPGARVHPSRSEPAPRGPMQSEPGTFTLGRLFGIPIRSSVTFGYLAAVLALVAVLGDPANGVQKIALLALLLVSLILHELGHALVARSFGVRVLDIKLWHLGGMARMAEIPESPRVEAAIAFAGPAVNLLLAGAAAPILFFAPTLGPAAFELTANFIGLNLLLGLLNLVPAFPMDGGRVLRAALASRVGFLAATETAVRVGRWTAFAMVVAAAWFWGPFGFLLALLVAGFVWFTGTKELLTVRMKHTGSPFGARGFAGAGGQAFGRAFGGAAGPGAGGPFQGGLFGGAASDAREAEATDAARAARSGSDSTTTEPPPVPRGARRPAVDSDVLPDETPRERRGFSEDDVERLERYRGPLRRRAAE